MTNKNAASVATFIVAGFIVIGLATAGIFLIVQSNKAYKKSLDYIEVALKDASLKSKISFVPGFANIKEGYTESFAYFSLAVGILLLVVLLPRLQNISFGGFSITLKDIQEQVNQLAKQSNELEAKVAGYGGGKTLDISQVQVMKSQFKENRKTLINENSLYPDDPQKGKWGGRSEANGRRLFALPVVESRISDLYEVSLIVESTSVIPLKGLVKFHLHDTFENPAPVIAVIDGQAKLFLKHVWGAFTVGVELDGGDTHLELDLAGDGVKAPKEFKAR